MARVRFAARESVRPVANGGVRAVVAACVRTGVTAVLLGVTALAAWPLAPAGGAVLAAESSDELFLDEDALFSGGDPFGSSGDDLSGSDEESLFGGSESDLFGGGDLLVDVERDGSVRSGGGLAEGLLVNEGIDAGGTFRMSLRQTRMWGEGSGLPGSPIAPSLDKAEPSTDSTLAAELYLDARPRADFRVYAEGSLDAAAPDNPFRLTELFADFDIADTAYVRAGKQTVKWGVGYFFSPADVINIGRIDPERPEAEREGPVAVKVNVPRGSDNFYLYAVFDKVGERTEVALAPRAEFVAGGTEWGLGAYYRPDRAPRAMATLSSSLGGVSVFGEAVVSRGSDKRFVTEAPVGPDNPFGFGVAVETREETTFVQATAGARFSYSDPDRRYRVSGAGQYFYNGEGYEGDFLIDHAAGVQALLHSKALRPTDLLDSGRHYAALALSGGPTAWDEVTPSLFWLGNLDDGSGRVSLILSMDLWEDIGSSISFSTSYGRTGSQFAPLGRTHAIMLELSLRRGSF